jgi:hypothetical protein
VVSGVGWGGAPGRPPRAPRAAAPILENRLTTYGIAAGALLVLALVAPLFARGWFMGLLLIAFAVAGIEIVRNVVLREEDQRG